jgi:anti-anti-sigma factor
MSRLVVEQLEGVSVIRLIGPMSAAEVQRLQPSFQEAAQGDVKRVVVDLSKVELLATPAITMFISAMNFQRKQGGRLIFTGTDGAIDKLLRVCRLDLIMTIVHDPEAAIAQAAR